jgi:hypothetical protein
MILKPGFCVRMGFYPGQVEVLVLSGPTKRARSAFLFYILGSLFALCFGLGSALKPKLTFRLKE